MRKLQVFISSTFEDMRVERQAAVMAILKAGHIPAGMELFTAGDESQLDAVKRWIEESDIYLLILGGRYGTIEKKSDRSYTEVEYRYALDLGKPLAAIVITEGCLQRKVAEHGEKGLSFVERDNTEKLRDFKALVESKMRATYDSTNEGVRLAVHETLQALERRDGLKGWVRSGSEGAPAEVTAELARLSQENATLRERAAGSGAAGEFHTKTGLDYGQLKAHLSKSPIRWLTADLQQLIPRGRPTHLDAVWHLRRFLIEGCWTEEEQLRELLATEVCPDLLLHGLVTRGRTNHGDIAYMISPLGEHFLRLLAVEQTPA